ncbi:hypothetical protein MKW92_052311 [Papaver armeniacum]|nr:hypothetical protein MKW92_052311 [Papaver armeniacum]
MVLWVFGYGSLVYNFGFDYDEKVVGFIKGHKRVFDLACIDHRGTPEHPARTCILEASEGEICWGAAFCVKGGPEKERLSMEYLERRECEYDLKASVYFYRTSESWWLMKILTILGKKENLLLPTPLRVVNEFLNKCLLLNPRMGEGQFSSLQT